MKYREELIKTANLMVSEGKGILAADESNPTCGKRFDLINLQSSEHSRDCWNDQSIMPRC